jgi:L-ascorbate metabolism protein UlaG (beta-lactamase superfamily)
MLTMLEKLTEEAFTQQLHTKFRVLLGEERAAELELDEVKPFPTLTHSRSDVERFSLYFYGPGDLLLPQMTYRLEHERMGEIDVFLVPIGQDARGFRYEAVFSFFK